MVQLQQEMLKKIMCSKILCDMVCDQVIFLILQNLSFLHI